ncbi:MAG: metal-dependent hydrolase [Thermoplasmata archaeon]
MDLFTHVILGYLLSYGIVGYGPQYLAAGAIAGGIPDADVLFFPLRRRFPLLRHHGITHSIVGVSAVALVGGLLIAPRISAGDPWIYVAVMEAAGLGHMLGDAFTHFSVAPLLPFHDRPLEIDADRAINFLTLSVSLGAIFLLGFERFRVPFASYTLTVYALMAFYGGYIALRLGARARIGAVRRRRPKYSVVVPTGNPLRWMLLYERREDGRLRTGYLLYHLGRGIVEGPFDLEVPLLADGNAAPTPAADAMEALERSYPIARRTGSMLDDTYHFARAEPTGPGAWTVHWYSLEYTAFGRAASVWVDIDPAGRLRARRGWARPPRAPGAVVGVK